MIKLQPGDYVSTKGMTEEQYHAVCKAFMDAGAEGYEYPTSLWRFIGFVGWSEDKGGLYHFDKTTWCGHRGEKGKRLLTINQILGSDNTEGTKEMNLKEAYKVMQANCGIEVGDTVKVLRKAEDFEMGWENSWEFGMNSYVDSEWLVTSIGDNGIQLDDVVIRYKFPFFVLEIVKKGKKLPDPIRISSQYQCEFKEGGSIDVGCQSLDFDLIEKIYMTAKGIKEDK